MEKLRIIVGGFIGRFPTGGVTWDYIQYPLGLHLLGHEVYYVEDTMQYPGYQSKGKKWNDASDSIQYLKQTMERFGLKDRWAYRDVASGKCFGLTLKKVLDTCRTADLFINISVSTYLRDEYLEIPKRVLVDSDPMFTQVQDWDDADPDHSVTNIRNRYGNYSDLFSFGENINALNCRIPTHDLKWEVTRQPICLDYWNFKSDFKYDAFTTVMNWSTRGKMKFRNEEWGQKDVEFEKFAGIPGIFRNTRFQVMVADSSKKLKRSSLQKSGWEVLDPSEKIRTIEDYQSFIQSSLGEFSVAKETYVKSNSGWFSCRSACYLASGKPVITQDTQWSKYIPSGLGLFAFSDITSAVDALTEVTSNVEKHSRAAREIAGEYFDSNKVLTELLSKL